MYNVIAFGEVLWDVIDGHRELGGAPANFIYHIGRQGTYAQIISAVGKDQWGSDLQVSLLSKSMNVSYIQEKDYPTSKVTVHLDANKNANYEIHENCAWDHITLDTKYLSLARDAHIFYFGTLCQRSEESRQTLYDLLEHLGSDCTIVCDINIRQHYYSKDILSRSFTYVDILKFNDEEWVLLAQLFQLELDPLEGIRQLLKRFNVRAVILTMGSEGSRLITENKDIIYKGEAIHVVDTVGAGDSYLASMAYGILNNLSWEENMKRATRIASYVCTQEGGMPDMPKELIEI